MDVTVEQLLQFIAELAVAAAAVAAFMRWLLRALDKRITSAIAPIAAEMAPNHGGSVKDKVDEIAAAVRSNTAVLEAERRDSKRRHEANVKALHRHDDEMSVIRRAVLAILMRESEGDQSPRLSELLRRIVEQLQSQEELAHDRRVGRWSDIPDDDEPDGGWPVGDP